MSTRYFFTALAGFFLGIALAPTLPLGFYGGVFTIFLGIVLVVFAYSSARASVCSKILSSVCIVLIAFGFGVMRLALSNTHEYTLDNFIGQPVVIEGIIVDEPDVRENSLRVILKPDALSERILVTTDRLSNFQYGDRVRISGKLAYPKNFVEQDGRIFDYVSYLAKDDVYYEMRFPKMEKVDSGEGNAIKEKLFAWKRAFLRTTSKNIPEPEASLLGGILLGTKQSLGSEILDDFKKTGLVHIVVLSGYNVSLVAEGIMKVFSFLPRLAALGVGAMSIFAFVVMTGASATAVRAGLMAVVVLMASYAGKQTTGVRLLVFAAFLMVLWNPRILLSDPSFQLSFLAALGLITLGPILTDRLHFITERWKLREIAGATLATQIFVLPLLLYSSGMFSFFALPANLLALPVVPLTMLLGFILGIAGPIFSLFAFPFAALAFFLLSYLFFIAKFFAHIPFNSFIIPVFPIWLLLFAYAALLVFVFQKK